MSVSAYLHIYIYIYIYIAYTYIYIYICTEPLLLQSSTKSISSIKEIEKLMDFSQFASTLLHGHASSSNVVFKRDIFKMADSYYTKF